MASMMPQPPMLQPHTRTAPFVPTLLYKTVPVKTCLSCGARTNQDGKLPCGH